LLPAIDHVVLDVREGPDARHRDRQARGFGMRGPQSFSRPVTLAGGITQHARLCTTHFYREVPFGRLAFMAQIHVETTSLQPAATSSAPAPHCATGSFRDRPVLRATSPSRSRRERDRRHDGWTRAQFRRRDARTELPGLARELIAIVAHGLTAAGEAWSHSSQRASARELRQR
jgi:hypothetical protein